jgi:hypothetical protein
MARYEYDDIVFEGDVCFVMSSSSIIAVRGPCTRRSASSCSIKNPDLTCARGDRLTRVSINLATEFWVEVDHVRVECCCYCR